MFYCRSAIKLNWNIKENNALQKISVFHFGMYLHRHLFILFVLVGWRAKRCRCRCLCPLDVGGADRRTFEGHRIRAIDKCLPDGERKRRWGEDKWEREIPTRTNKSPTIIKMTFGRKNISVHRKVIKICMRTLWNVPPTPKGFRPGNYGVKSIRDYSLFECFVWTHGHLGCEDFAT